MCTTAYVYKIIGFQVDTEKNCLINLQPHREERERNIQRNEQQMNRHR